MKRYFVFIFLGFVLVSCKQKPTPENVREVYICTSSGAKAYHAREDCLGLANCSGDVKKVDKEEVSFTRNPCSMCISKTDNEKEEETGGIGKYVYLDECKEIHIDRKCPILLEERADRVLSNEIPYNVASYCLQCVSDEDYDRLMGMQ